MNDLVQINYIDETGKSFKLFPKRYKSSFNKLTLVSDEYKIYCEQIEEPTIEADECECDTELVIQYLGQQLRKSVFDKITTSTKVEW